MVILNEFESVLNDEILTFGKGDTWCVNDNHFGVFLQDSSSLDVAVTGFFCGGLCDVFPVGMSLLFVSFIELLVPVLSC